MTLPIKRIGVLTGGGDAPGLNAVIRAVVKSAATAGIECIGLEDSFDGLIYTERSRVLTLRDVTGILRLGGTILGTTNRGNPFAYPVQTGDGEVDYSNRCVENFHKLRLDALVVIGGDGTLSIAHDFHKRGIPVVGVPKTIDNDIVETSMTFGFDTAVAFATEALDRLHTTAEAHHRVMVVEVMGRYTGWIALYAGIGGGADVVLIPEIPYDLAKVARPHPGTRKARRAIQHRRRRRRRTSGWRRALGRIGSDAGPRRAARRHRRARRLQLEVLTQKEARFVVLGHLQRGGSPLAYDRVLATRFGSFAVELLQRGEHGVMTALRSPDLVAIPLESRRWTNALRAA